MFLEVNDIVILSGVEWRVVARNQKYKMYRIQLAANKKIVKVYPERVLFLTMQGYLPEDNRIPRYVDTEDLLK